MKKTLTLIIAGSMSILAGCTVVSDHAELETRTATRLEAMLVDTNGSPGSGKPGSTRLGAGATRYTGVVALGEATQQRSVLLSGSVAGLPANRIEITRLASSGSTAELFVSQLKPTDAGIHAELASRFPRVTMKLVTEPQHNEYGPLGMAIGAPTSRVRCVYAWQYLEDLPVGDNRQTTRALFRVNPASAAGIRISVCRAATTADQLAAFVEQLPLDASPASQSGSLEATLAAPAVDISPLASGARSKPSRRPRHRSARVRTARAISARPDRVEVEPYPARGNVSPGPADPGTVRGSLSSVPVPSTLPLDPTLPSQAYLGPSSSKPALSRAIPAADKAGSDTAAGQNR